MYFLRVLSDTEEEHLKIQAEAISGAVSKGRQCFLPKLWRSELPREVGEVRCPRELGKKERSKFLSVSFAFGLLFSDVSSLGAC